MLTQPAECADAPGVAHQIQGQPPQHLTTELIRGTKVSNKWGRKTSIICVPRAQDGNGVPLALRRREH